MNARDILKTWLVTEEGDRKKPYKDQFGNLTIGLGHNLTANGISQAVEDLLYAEDSNAAELGVRLNVRNFDDLSPIRQAVLMDMCFNMGEQAFGEFHGMIAAVEAGDWNGAADHMLASKWAQELPTRAQTLAGHMRAGG